MEWINVKDKLPPIGQKVLVFETGFLYGPRIATFNGETWKRVDNEGLYMNPKYVKHWMPLPDKPQEPEEHDFPQVGVEAIIKGIFEFESDACRIQALLMDIEDAADRAATASERLADALERVRDKTKK